MNVNKKKMSNKKLKRSDYLNMMPKNNKQSIDFMRKNFSNYLRNINEINVLAKTKKKDVKSRMIKNMNANELKGIREVVKAVLNGEIPIPNNIKSKFKKHKHAMRQFVMSSTSNEKRKNILKQKGGFIPLIPIAAKVLAPVAASIIGPAVGAVGGIFKKLFKL